MAKKKVAAKRRAPKFDPVEDAKTPVVGEEPPAEAKTPAEAPVEPEASAEAPPEPAEPSTEEVVPGVPPPKNPEPPKRLPLYEVTERTFAQIGGLRHRLNVGKRIDTESYGEKAIVSLRQQGVKLREIKR